MREFMPQPLVSSQKSMEDLLKYIPSGAHQCHNDKVFTLVNVTQSFLSMFGYTQEELEEKFQNQYIQMIDPEDRQRVRWEIEVQLQKGSNIEIEYRVCCKNGNIIWVLSKGQLLANGVGNGDFYSILVEINDRRREQEELRLSLERYQVITDQATDIIFEWDIRKDTLHFSPNFYKKFGYHPVARKISCTIPVSPNIHENDIEAFAKIMKDCVAGVPYSETEFRIRNLKGRFYWCRIRATVQYDEIHKPIKAIGVILDIDEEKRQKQVLLDQAQRDALTGLYNKAAINALVEERMMQKGLCGFQALLIIDVDYFKQVNDTYGHLCGDSLLSDVATVLRNHVRFSDLVGRIGGDEFLIYFPEITDQTAAEGKAKDLLSALRQLIPEQGAEPITCSLGAAFFPRSSIDYFALYKCADQALYTQKENGRDGVTFYSPSLSANQMPCGQGESAVGSFIVSDEGTVKDEHLAQYVFRSLYEATDTKEALNRLLEIVGRSYDVSRVYIFESSKDGQRCSNTFEWCNQDVVPQIDTLRNLSYQEDLDDYLQNFDKRGLFYCAEIKTLPPKLKGVLEPQGICSMLQCAVLDEGKFCGLVGFDECRQNRKWGGRQVSMFRLTANIISVFLMKLRLKEGLGE